MPPKDLGTGQVIAPCAAEGNPDAAGADGGAVWLVCPTIPDPTRGGIAKGGFLDTFIAQTAYRLIRE
jgi:hypothetical protein